MDPLSIAAARHTCKAYDPQKKLTAEQVRQFCELLRLAPSSVNSQPWHFIVVASDEAKALIAQGVTEANASKIRNCSHAVVFCSKDHLSEAYLQYLLANEDRDGRFSNKDARQGQDKGRRHFVELNSHSLQSQQEWMTRQVYLAFGFSMFAAAGMGIDSTPLEGIFRDKLDELLELPRKGLHAQLVMCLGYRDEQADFNARLPKSRRPLSDVVTTI